MLFKTCFDSLLSDKMNCTVSFSKQFSKSQHGTGQESRYESGTLRKQLTKPTAVHFVTWCNIQQHHHDALHSVASIRPSLLLELLLLALAELPLETGVLLGGLGHATHLVNAAQQEATLPAITIRKENRRRLPLTTSARLMDFLPPLPFFCNFTQPSLLHSLLTPPHVDLLYAFP